MLIMPLFSRTRRALPFLFLLLLHPFFVCEGARILSLSMFASRSHKNVYEPLLLELSRRGHEVTSVNPVRSSSTNSSSNASSVREIVGIPIDVLIPTSTPAGGGGFNVFDHIEAFQGSMFSSLQGYLTWLQGTQRRCPEFFALPQIQAVLQPTDGGTKPPFDLVLINPVSNECLLGAVHRLGVPSIFITTLTTPFWIAGPAVGDPTLPSHIPSFFSMVPPNAVWPFRERLDAFLCHVLLTVFMDFVYYPWVESLYRAEFGSATPGVHEIMANASLILSNSHYSLNFPRPTMPNHIDVGGMHCRPARPLPADLDEFLRSGEEGFIYFSMGSVIQANAMPPEYRALFLNTFSALASGSGARTRTGEPVRVLWKWENETLGGVVPPPGVKISRWVPQQDVLGHPKCRLFITHGGLLSTEEAVFHGRPLIGFPIYGDQHNNMKHAQDAGFALKLDFSSLTEEILMDAITTVLQEPRFKAQALALSKTFRDRPQSALDLAVYWVEYVLRHGGAPHLKSPARLLSMWAYYSVDVIAFLAACVLILVYAAYKLIFVLFKLVFGSEGGLHRAEKTSQQRKKMQ